MLSKLIDRNLANVAMLLVVMLVIGRMLMDYHSHRHPLGILVMLVPLFVTAVASALIFYLAICVYNRITNSKIMFWEIHPVVLTLITTAVGLMLLASASYYVPQIDDYHIINVSDSTYSCHDNGQLHIPEGDQ